MGFGEGECGGGGVAAVGGVYDVKALKSGLGWVGRSLLCVFMCFACAGLVDH